MTLQLLPSEFPYIWGYFLYQGRGIGFSLEKLMFKLESALTKNQGNILNPFINDRNLLVSESPHLFLVNIRIGRIFQRTFPAVGRGRRQHYEAVELRTQQIPMLSMPLMDICNIIKIVVQWGWGYNTEPPAVSEITFFQMSVSMFDHSRQQNFTALWR
jgi:hypothetical protein